MILGSLLTIKVIVLLSLPSVLHTQSFEEQVQRVVDAFEEPFKMARSLSAMASWDYNTNITTFNQEKVSQAGMVYSNFFTVMCNVLRALQRNNSITNATLLRRVNAVTSSCRNSQTNTSYSEWRRARLSKLSTDLQAQWSTAKVRLNGKDIQLDPDLREFMGSSRDFWKLLRGWIGWYDSSTKNMKPWYEEYVNLTNEVSVEEGFKDRGEAWRATFEHQPPANFESDLEKLWSVTKPLFQQLHGYVRFKLMNYYSNKDARFKDYFPESGHIPMHLTGNLWGQTWETIFDILQPFDRPSLDITNALKEKGYDAKKMNQDSEKFFLSLGLPKMPESYYTKSMFEKPTDRQVVCQASAWNLFNEDDVRVKMCTQIHMNDYIVVHHEMGHIQYYLNYLKEPVVFQAGANPGFHEAIGDTISLSVTTPKHLKSMGLLEQSINYDHETKINYLFNQALQKVIFLPFGYMVDLWRWRVFNGSIQPDQYGNKWWELVCKYQGQYPPSKRAPGAFDAGSKFHVPANSQYISYFISYIMQFQFYQRMCSLANHTGALDECDFYNSTIAGEPFKKMLSYGSRQPWQETLKEFLGSNASYDAQSLMVYFDPLYKYLVEFNTKNNINATWDETKCPESKDVDLPADEEPPSGPNVGLIVGIVLGVIVLVVLLCVGGFVAFRWYQSRLEEQSPGYGGGAPMQEPPRSYPPAQGSSGAGQGGNGRASWNKGQDYVNSGFD